VGPVYQFGRFVLNLERGCLQEDDRDLPLRPKSFQVLHELVQHAGKLMAKDDLVRAVWPNVFVSDDSLAQCVRDIRKVLGDDAEQFIRTVPRRGYMFVAEVAAVEPARAPPARSRSGSPPDEAAFEQAYRARLGELYGEAAEYYVPLSAQTSEARPADAPKSASRRRRLARPEYQEWLQTGDEITHVTLNSLRDAVERYGCVVLLGDPGCGKTATLESLAYEYSLSGSTLPVPAALGGFLPSESVRDFVARSWSSLLDADGSDAPADPAATLQRYLESGRLLVLLDALNEMPLDRRAERCVALRQFIDRWSAAGNRFVVTCRALDYGDELHGLQRVAIQPLGDDQIRRFIANELPGRADSLWQALTRGEDSPRLLEMARNPYLLTVMIDVYEARGELTRDRAGLMRQLVGILVGWAASKGPARQSVDPELLNAALATVAFEMQQRSGFGTTARTDDVKRILPREIEISPGWPAQPCDPDRILGFAAGAKIVEMPADRKTLRFYHQLLQEFFAAQRMLALDPSALGALWRWPWREDEMPPWSRPEGNFDPLPPPPSTGWEETTILAAGLGQGNDGALVRALCRINPVLAGRCVLDARPEISAAVREHVVRELLAVIADPVVALRVRIAAGDVLGRLGDPRLGAMIAVPAGGFTMGAEGERHEVVLPDYCIGRYPVTNAEYAAFVAGGGYASAAYWTEAGWKQLGNERDEPRFWRSANFNRPNQPVIGLSWYECVAYCRWLTAQSGRLHRLPTEAEWEKAARGSAGTTYPWGDALDASRLNAREGSQKVYCTTPVGIYPTGASPHGLLDCAGNVWEWCATRWRKSYPYDPGEDEWSGSYCEGQSLRVLRGGSWNYEARESQCANRFRFDPYGWNDRGGFRIVGPAPR